eukprot:gene8549-9462_t
MWRFTHTNDSLVIIVVEKSRIDCKFFTFNSILNSVETDLLCQGQKRIEQLEEENRDLRNMQEQEQPNSLCLPTRIFKNALRTPSDPLSQLVANVRTIEWCQLTECTKRLKNMAVKDAIQKGEIDPKNKEALKQFRKDLPIAETALEDIESPPDSNDEEGLLLAKTKQLNALQEGSK